MQGMGRVRLALAIGLTSGAMLAGSALAQPTSAQQAALRSACQSDYRAHCASVPPGGAPALQCLQQNLASLSAACQSAVNAASGGSTAAPAATAPAAGANPAAAAPATAPATGKSATKAPTPANPATTSPAAPGPALSPRQELALVRQACRRDFRAYCSNVPLGGGNVVACLRANAAKLSAGCKGAIAAAMQ